MNLGPPSHSRLEFSRIRSEISKTQKANFQSCGRHFGACSAPRPQKAPIFEHFQIQTRNKLQIAPKSTFSTIFNSRTEFSRTRGEISKTQKAHVQSCGRHFEAFSAPRPQKAPMFEHFQLQTRKTLQIAPKGTHFQTFSAEIRLF